MPQPTVATSFLITATFFNSLLETLENRDNRDN